MSPEPRRTFASAHFRYAAIRRYHLGNLIAYGERVSRPAKIVAVLVFVGAVAFAIAGYFAARGSDESYWAPLVPVFVSIYGGIALGLVVGVDAAIRSAMRWHRARLAKPF
jgi:hypothetical protein